MNRFINSVLLFIAILTLGFVVIVGKDLPIDFLRTTGQYLPYKNAAFIAIAGVFILIGGRRSMQRWMGTALIRKTERYQWNVPIGKERQSRTIFYLVLEGSFHLAIAGVFLSLTMDSLPVAIALALLAFDHFLYAWLGHSKKIFRIGITKAALVLIDRDVRILYFSGLRKISMQQRILFFEYIKDLEMDISSDAVPEDKRAEFREVLKQQIDLDRVYLDESFKNFN